jgi:hypothetical protein
MIKFILGPTIVVTDDFTGEPIGFARNENPCLGQRFSGAVVDQRGQHRMTRNSDDPEKRTDAQPTDQSDTAEPSPRATAEADAVLAREGVFPLCWYVSEEVETTLDRAANRVFWGNAPTAEQIHAARRAVADLQYLTEAVLAPAAEGVDPREVPQGAPSWHPTRRGDPFGGDGPVAGDDPATED